MVGIIGYIGDSMALPIIANGLKNLEYRGHDSTGIALVEDDLTIYKQADEIDDSELPDASNSTCGIGHTRWSTHGPPTDDNAHPHTDESGQVAVVHNGIIGNFQSLRSELEATGHVFQSDTDTEVVPHLIEESLRDGATPDEAFRAAVGRLSGTYALAAVIGDEEAIFATRSGSPLVLGVGDAEYYLASDVPAFIHHTDRVVYLEDGDFAVLSREGWTVTALDGTPLDRPVDTVDWAPDDAEKQGYDHYMLKEIHEQPLALAQTLRGRISADYRDVHLEEFPPDSFTDVSEVQFVACGTSYHAAMYAHQLLVNRGIPAQAFLAGEYSTNPVPATENTLIVGVTQSGETADTLTALRRAQGVGARTLAVTNVVDSTAARECDEALYIRAGPEIGVAATKTFSSQVASLALLCERIVEDVTGSASADRAAVLEALANLPDYVQRVVEEAPTLDLAQKYRDSEAYFFIGRGIVYPVALEGALKFKEITYEHAEGFAASELKHGPLTLVTPDTPVLAVFSGRHDEKMLHNVKEVQARDAPVIVVASEENEAVAAVADDLLTIPQTHPDIAGILVNVRLQLVSYSFARVLGQPIDKPSNPAKYPESHESPALREGDGRTLQDIIGDAWMETMIEWEEHRSLEYDILRDAVLQDSDGECTIATELVPANTGTNPFVPPVVIDPEGDPDFMILSLALEFARDLGQKIIRELD